MEESREVTGPEGGTEIGPGRRKPSAGENGNPPGTASASSVDERSNMWPIELAIDTERRS